MARYKIVDRSPRFLPVVLEAQDERQLRIRLGLSHRPTAINESDPLISLPQRNDIWPIAFTVLSGLHQWA